MQLRLKRLEERIVFDAAAAPVDTAEPPPVETADDGADTLIVVDKAMAAADGYTPPDDGSLVVEYDSRSDSLQELQDMITAACGDTAVDSIVFAGYGSDGGAALSLEAVLALAGSGDATDLATFLDHLAAALQDHGGDDNALDPDLTGDGFGQLLEETTGMPFASRIGPQDADAPDTDTDDGGDDSGEDDDDDDVAALGAEENYINNNNIIHFEESDRVIEGGSAFREPGKLEFGTDPGGQAHQLLLEFSLYKNGELISLYDYLAFQNDLAPMSDSIIGIEIDGVMVPLDGLDFSDGKFCITLYYVTTDPEGVALADPYYAVMAGNGILVDVNRFFDGDGSTPNIIFSDTPGGTTSDVFNLKLRASAKTSAGKPLPGEFEGSAEQNFPVDPDDGDDDGGDDPAPPSDDYFENNEIIHLEESDRVIEPGSSFREPGYLDFGEDAGGQADRIILDFTLYKNGEPVSLTDYLEVQGNIIKQGQSYYYKLDNVNYSLSALMSDGKLNLYLYYVTTDSAGEALAEPYYGVRLKEGLYIDVNKFFSGSGTDANIIFGSTPDCESGDVFTLKVSGSGITADNKYLPGRIDKSVELKFSDGSDDGGDDGGGDEPRPDNYLNEYDIIHYTEAEREIEAGTAFRDPDSFHLNPDTGGDLAKLELSFTLLKNGEPVDLLEYLGFQNDVKLDPDNPGKVMMDVLGNGDYRQLTGVTLSDGKLLLTLDYSGDMTNEPFSIRLAGEPPTFVDIGSFFDGNGSPNVVFSSTPEAEAGDVFSLQLNADPFGSDVAPLEGRYQGSVPITFKKTSNSGGDDDGGESGGDDGGESGGDDGDGDGGNSGGDDGEKTDPVDPVKPPSPPTNPTPPPGSEFPAPPIDPPRRR